MMSVARHSYLLRSLTSQGSTDGGLLVHDLPILLDAQEEFQTFSRNLFIAEFHLLASLSITLLAPPSKKSRLLSNFLLRS